MASDIVRTEIAVVGSGLAGLPLAIACAGVGVPVVMIDRATPERLQDEAYDGRTTAIAYGSKLVLQGIGVWTHLEAEAEPILDIRVADQNSSLFLHYDHREVGADPLGWIVENRTFRRALAAVAERTKDLAWLAPATVQAVIPGETGVEIVLNDGCIVRARLAVAADGKNSSVREQAGIGTIGWTYPQHSITFNVEHERPHHGAAVEHFFPGGPFAILPMSGNRSSIVWTERSELVPAYMAMDEHAFGLEVARRFGEWLGAVRVIGPRTSLPLQVMVARRITAQRLALVGDAAHVIHPIAGQGLNLGLRDVAALAELVVDTCRLGLDPGSPKLLNRYETRRQIDTLSLAAVTDGLNRLFSNHNAPLKLARDLGLAVVNRTQPLKRLFMRHAMGISGPLPRLARGDAL